MKRTTFRLAVANEESKGIDGYVGQTPVSIKPMTYKTKLGLPESIRIPIIYYEKLKDRVTVEAESILGKEAKLC